MAGDDLVLGSLTGGLNEDVPPSALATDECEVATNVEFYYSLLGERRAGCDTFDLTSSGLTTKGVIAYLGQWFPANDIRVPEWWAVGATAGVSVAVAKRRGGTWSAVSPDDAITTAAPNIYHLQTVALNGKLFWSYPSAVDRLHVWDATYLRRTGMAQPNAPTGADEGSGTYATVRYFRVRYIEKTGSIVVRRSEPSTALAFTPSGSGKGCRITKPATVSEHETHWEVEASTDNSNFYVIAEVAVGTATYDDETVYATGYSGAGALSENIGTYQLQPSAKYLAVDGDRLLGAGHWTDASLQSQVWWSPVSADPGDGNDERKPLSVNNWKNIDNYRNGPVTGISNAVNGTWYVFKWKQITRMTRTGDLNHAYDDYTISPERGALPGSVIDGVDEAGAAAVYFLDPTHGPSRIGSAGLQVIRGLKTTWARVNLNAANVITHGVYYPYKQQVWWWVAVDGEDEPSLILKLQVNQVRWSDETGYAHRGWSLATGRIAQAYCSAVLSEVSITDGVVGLSGYPFIGLSSPDLLCRCDVNTTDVGVAYKATVRTRPLFGTGLLNFWGVMSGALLASAQAGTIVVRLIRDFGKETNEVTVDLSPEGSEAYVVEYLDNLKMSEAKCIQIEFEDPA